MREIFSVIGGVLVALGMVAVIAVGILWDEMQYEERMERRRREKERDNGETD